MGPKPVARYKWKVEIIMLIQKTLQTVLISLAIAPVLLGSQAPSSIQSSSTSASATACPLLKKAYHCLVYKTPTEARAAFMEVIEKSSDAWAKIEAQCRIGCYLVDGFGGPKNRSSARKYLEQAVDQTINEQARARALKKINEFDKAAAEVLHLKSPVNARYASAPSPVGSECSNLSEVSVRNFGMPADPEPVTAVPAHSPFGVRNFAEFSLSLDERKRVAPPIETKAKKIKRTIESVPAAAPEQTAPQFDPQLDEVQRIAEERRRERILNEVLEALDQEKR